MNTLKLGFRVSKTDFDKHALKNGTTEEHRNRHIQLMASTVMRNTIVLEKFMKTTETEDEMEFELEIVIPEGKENLSCPEVESPKE